MGRATTEAGRRGLSESPQGPGGGDLPAGSTMGKGGGKSGGGGPGGNWPSTTSNPSGGGRGNAPPGGKK